MNLIRSLAIDHGPKGIRVNCVCPGAVDTPLLREELRGVGSIPTRASATPPTRDHSGGSEPPTTVAAAIAYLVSDDARYVTGAVLLVDRGWLAGG